MEIDSEITKIMRLGDSYKVASMYFISMLKNVYGKKRTWNV